MTDANFPAIAAAIRSTLEEQGFTKLVGAEVVSVEPGVVVMALDRRPEVLQQNGLFHGGVLAYLIDNATTAAAGTMIDRANAQRHHRRIQDQSGGAFDRRPPHLPRRSGQAGPHAHRGRGKSFLPHRRRGEAGRGRACDYRQSGYEDAAGLSPATGPQRGSRSDTTKGCGRPCAASSCRARRRQANPRTSCGSPERRPAPETKS